MPEPIRGDTDAIEITGVYWQIDPSQLNLLRQAIGTGDHYTAGVAFGVLSRTGFAEPTGPEWRPFRFDALAGTFQYADAEGGDVPEGGTAVFGTRALYRP